jgi:hypothetical protein
MSADESQNVPGPGDGRASHERGPAGEAAHPDDAMTHFAEFIVNRLFSVGLSLDSAHSIIGKGPAGDRVAVAADEVDRLIREIRDYVFGEGTQGTQVGPPQISEPDDRQRSSQTADRVTLMHERMARAARALQASAAHYATLLERRADLARQPGRLDYPAEIKRWRAFAGQAGQMAERWEQSPLPGSHRRPGQAQPSAM